MSAKSEIEWTDATWNPTTGCTKVSPGCAHCYIERTPAFRIKGRRFVAGRTGVQLHENRLDQPLHWRKPRRIFVNSLSDLFHDDIPNEFIAEVFHVMYGEASTKPTPEHIYQILTKRPQRMLDWFAWLRTYDGPDAMIAALSQYLQLQGPHRRVWLGVSVENQHFANVRIPLLLQTPAAVRFISAEPLLESIDLTNVYIAERHYRKDALRRSDLEPPLVPDAKLDWVIVGGESGPKSRPFALAWARDIVRQCQDAGVPCFVKQIGSNAIDGVHCDDETESYPLRFETRDRKGGEPYEWPEDLRVRQFPT